MKYLYGLAATLAIGVLIFYSLWAPLPDAPARDALGEERFIQIADRQLAYYVHGKGKPIIMLASAGREASDFNELARSLNGAGYRTIAIEAQGIKGSALPNGDMDLFDMADDVNAVVDAEIGEGETAAILGHAFGNRAARAFATKYDARVNAVILIASGGSIAIPPKANASLKAVFDPRLTVSQRKADIDYAFFAKENEIPAYWMTGWYRHTAVLQGKASGLTPYPSWSGGGTKPMLVLQGAEDEIAPMKDTGARLAEKYPERVKLVVIEGAGHALLPEQPDAIAKAVIEFLN